MLYSRQIEKFYYQILAGANIFVVFLLWLLAGNRFRIAHDFVPLHYTIYFGLDRFGPKHDLFLFPVLGAIILIMNIIIIRKVVDDSALWKGIVLGLSFIMQIILLVSFVLAILKALS